MYTIVSSVNNKSSTTSFSRHCLHTWMQKLSSLLLFNVFVLKNQITTTSRHHRKTVFYPNLPALLRRQHCPSPVITLFELCANLTPLLTISPHKKHISAAPPVPNQGHQSPGCSMLRLMGNFLVNVVSLFLSSAARRKWRDDLSHSSLQQRANRRLFFACVLVDLQPRTNNRHPHCLLQDELFKLIQQALPLWFTPPRRYRERSSMSDARGEQLTARGLWIITWK